MRPLLRACWQIGVVGPRRGLYWGLLATGLRRGGRAGFAKAVTLAILGEHHLRYTQEVVLPRLDRALRGERERREPAPTGAPADPPCLTRASRRWA
jgi:hypothetical protein